MCNNGPVPAGGQGGSVVTRLRRSPPVEFEPRISGRCRLRCGSDPSPTELIVARSDFGAGGERRCPRRRCGIEVAAAALLSASEYTPCYLIRILAPCGRNGICTPAFAQSPISVPATRIRTAHAPCPATPPIACHSRERLDRACACRVAAPVCGSGEDCRAEEYFAADPSLAESEECAFILIVTEFIVRASWGKRRARTSGRYAFRTGANDCARRSEPTRRGLSVTDDVPTVRAPESGTADTIDGPGTGTVFGRYELLDELGRGGMGVVFRALGWQTRSHGRSKDDRRWSAGDRRDPHFPLRARKRARPPSRFRHPNIIPLYEFGQHQGYRYFTMPLALGRQSARQHRAAFHDARAAAALVATIAQRLPSSTLTDHGVIHRDLKPANVLLDENHQPRWWRDFGLAKLAGGEEQLTYSRSAIGHLGLHGSGAGGTAGSRGRRLTPMSGAWV